MDRSSEHATTRIVIREKELLRVGVGDIEILPSVKHNTKAATTISTNRGGEIKLQPLNATRTHISWGGEI